jgi:cell division protein FtsX
MKPFNIAILLLALSTALFADASSLFTSATTKVNSFNDGLKVIGVAILTLSIMIAAIGAAMGWFSKVAALRIFAGGLVFGMAATLAAWLIN